MDTSWFELRADGEKVAAFSYGDSGQTYDEAKGKVSALLEVTRGDLYKDKVLQIIEVRRGLSANTGMPGGLREKIIHEEHPTVWDFEWGPEPSTKAVEPPTPYELSVL